MANVHERTRIDRLYQEGAAKIRFPGAAVSEGAEAVLINTGGGLTGGDSLSWEIEVGPDCDLAITTQACEKIYKSADGTAAVETRLIAARGSSVAWLPQETILFDQGRLDRTLNIEMVEDARVLICEAVVFGRTARNETFSSGAFVDRWRVTRNDTIVHREDTRFLGDTGALLEGAAVLGGRAAMATLMLFAEDAESFVEPARNCASSHEAVNTGISAWRVGETGKLLARMVAGDGYDLRKALVPVLEVLSQRAEVPKVWSI